MGADAKPPATARMVRDNPALNRYELKLGDAMAFATYVREPGRITLIHTEVPKELGGHGVGTALATGALADIRGRGEKVIDWNIEKPLDLSRVQVQSKHTIRTGPLNQVCNQPGGDRHPRLIFPILPRIPIIG